MLIPTRLVLSGLRGLAAAFLLLSLAVTAALAQGTITGRVSNATTGAHLEGAEVSIPSLGLSTLTDRDGSFTLTGVPAGEQNLRVFYTGLDLETRRVIVRTGERAEASVALTTGGIQQLEAFTVSSSR